MTNRTDNRQGWMTIAVLLIGALAIAFMSPRGIKADDEHKGHDHGDGGRKAENWAPLSKLHLYLCAFHVAKENPSFQVEAHHYCAPVAKDVHQCVIYDSRGPNPKLLGVEYIVSDETYQKLPDSEKKYWHPHAYEIISGQLIAADLPKQGDDMFPGLISTWGKTWHTWRDPSTELPTGDPLLMWSANGDGQIDQKLISKRDAQFGISSAEIRERRKTMGYEIPQVPPPKSMNEVGRRWTATGPDTPKKNSAGMK